MGAVPNPTPSEKKMNQMFGFVTDEDRQRWQRGLSDADRERINQGPKPIFGPKLAEQGVKLGERFADQQRQAALNEEARRLGDREPKNWKRTTTTVEHIHEEPDDDFEFGG